MTYVSDPLVHRVIGCAIAVHRELGPGLLESSYSRCFQAELAYRGIAFKTEVGVHITYRDLRIDNAYRIDLLVDDWLVVEVKATESILQVHAAQVMTYLRLTGARQGLIINFNCARLKDGLKSVPRDPILQVLQALRPSKRSGFSSARFIPSIFM
jgi:GxxExxY protein